MTEQGKTLTFFLIQLMFSESQAKNFVGKKWRIYLPMKFYADFFSSHKVRNVCYKHTGTTEYVKN